MKDEDKLLVFESLPINKAVLRQAVPAVASQLIALVYSLADTWFVGLLNDPVQTAAVTVVYPSFVMLTAVSNLAGVGGAAALARALGGKRQDDARDISAVSFWMGLILAMAFIGVFAAFAKPILTLCGAADKSLPVALGYAKYAVVLGGVFTVLSALTANLLRAEGAAGAASIGLSAGGLINILLDPLFILPRFMGLGAAGAGLATAVSNMASMGIFLGYLLIKRKSTRICLSPGRLKNGLKFIGVILKTGLPSAVQYALTVVAVAAQARFVSKYGNEAVAGLGIVKKLDQLPLYFSIGVATGLLPLLAYNHASGDEKRLREGSRFGILLSLGFSLICLVVYELFAPDLATLFIKDASTVRYAAAFLRRMVTAMPLMAVCYPLIIRFQATGRSRDALICSVLRKGVLDIPLLFLMDALLPLYGLMWVQPIVDGASLAAALALLRRGRARQQNPAARAGASPRKSLNPQD